VLTHLRFDDQVIADLHTTLSEMGQEHRTANPVQDENWIGIYDDDADTVLAAAAALILQNMTAAVPDIMLNGLWDIVVPHLPEAPHPRRAVFAQGVAILYERSILIEKPEVRKRDMISLSKSDIEHGLLPVARKLRDCIDVVAKADYGYGENEHERALRDLLDKDFAQIPLTERWVPMEVLELRSHVPKEFGHIPSLAIVLLDAARTDDHHGHVEFRWVNQHAELCQLPSSVRVPILNAFRYFYENDLAFAYF